MIRGDTPELNALDLYASSPKWSMCIRQKGMANGKHANDKQTKLDAWIVMEH